MALQPTQQNEILNLFNYKNKQLRTITVGYITYFHARDSGNILGYSNPASAIRTNVDDRDKVTFASLLALNDGCAFDCTQSNIDDKAVMINESGLYDLVFESHKPEAKAFRRWIMTEVIPSIRKTGGYSMNPEKSELTAQQQLQKQHLHKFQPQE